MTPPKRSHAATPEEECLAMLGGMTIYKKETVELLVSAGLKVKMMPGKVNNIAKMFEIQQSATKTGPEPEHRLYIDNNTSVFSHRTGYTELGSSRQYPEMALQSQSGLGAKPMAHQQGGQVTMHRWRGANHSPDDRNRTDHHGRQPYCAWGSILKAKSDETLMVGK